MPVKNGTEAIFHVETTDYCFKEGNGTEKWTYMSCRANHYTFWSRAYAISMRIKIFSLTF